MRHVIENRSPLTEEEVWKYLTDNVERNIKRWGEDYIYTTWAKEARDEKFAKWKNGEVVVVKVEQFVDSYGNGCGDYEDWLYSDGRVETACYGYLD